MDIRILLVTLIITAVLAFFIGRRTAPGGRTVHRLQKDLDGRNQELSNYQQQMHQFMVDMQHELDRVSSAYRELQNKLKAGNARFLQHAKDETDIEIPAIAASEELKLPACPIPSEPPTFEPPRDYSPVRGTLASRQAYA